MSPFEPLEINQLKNVMGNLRLEATQLKNKLAKLQWKELLNLAQLPPEQHQNLKANGFEKAGQIALVLNTIVTSMFGAWMGFHAFTGSKTDSFFQFSIVGTLTFVLSIFFGYSGFKYIKNNALASIEKQKLLNIERDVLQLIIKKNNQEQEKVINSINKSLNLLLRRMETGIKAVEPTSFIIQCSDDFCKKINGFLKLITTIECSFSSKIIDIIFDEKLKNNRTQLVDYLATINHRESYLDNKNNRDDSLLAALTAPADFRIPKFSFSSWIQTNYLSLIVGLFPTLFGCFASMFVFLSGGPDLAKSLGFWSLLKTLKHPTSQLIEFFSAVSLTVYYGSSFAYNKYKLYTRTTQEEKTKKIIADLEQDIANIESEILILKRINNDVLFFVNSYTSLDRLCSSFPQSLFNE